MYRHICNIYTHIYIYIYTWFYANIDDFLAQKHGCLEKPPFIDDFLIEPFISSVFFQPATFNGAVGGAHHGPKWSVPCCPDDPCMEHLPWFTHIYPNMANIINIYVGHYSSTMEHLGMCRNRQNFTNRSRIRRIRWSASAPSTQLIRPSFASLGAKKRPGRRAKRLASAELG